MRTQEGSLIDIKIKHKFGYRQPFVNQETMLKIQATDIAIHLRASRQTLQGIQRV